MALSLSTNKASYLVGETAIDGATPEAIALRNKMIAKKGSWAV